MRDVSALLRTFATELRTFLAKMRSPLRKNTNTRLLLFGLSYEPTKFYKDSTPKV